MERTASCRFCMGYVCFSLLICPCSWLEALLYDVEAPHSSAIRACIGSTLEEPCALLFVLPLRSIAATTPSRSAGPVVLLRCDCHIKIFVLDCRRGAAHTRALRSALLLTPHLKLYFSATQNVVEALRTSALVCVEIGRDISLTFVCDRADNSVICTPCIVKPSIFACTCAP